MHLEKKSKRRQFGREAEGDMMPMIDVTFQLIAFFMLLINFTQAEQDARIKLPMSELAKPPEEQPEEPITLHVAGSGSAGGDQELVIFGGREHNLNELGASLRRRATELNNRPNFSARQATVIIRADVHAPTGLVQKVIETAQKSDFETFKLRAEQERRR